VVRFIVFGNSSAIWLPIVWISFSIEGIQAGNSTTGHKIYFPKKTKVRSFIEYKDALRKMKVVIDQEERRKMILNQMGRKLATIKAELHPDEGLLERLIYDIEYPHVILDLFTMHGFPTETEEEAMMTLNFIKSLKWCHFAYVFVVKIFPNTDLAKLAIDHGVSPEAISRSDKLALHELPDTLPFDKGFTLKYQAAFFNEYFFLILRMITAEIKPKIIISPSKPGVEKPRL